jgi:nitrogen PTS system EIIA component
MKLANILKKECIYATAEIENKSSALKFIANIAKKSPVLSGVDEQVVLKGLREREELGTTGFGNGIAIPHCRLDSITDFVLGIITVPSGVDFDSTDKKKTRLLVFIIAPANRSNEHIRLLSHISQALLTPGIIDKIVLQKTAEQIYQSFTGCSDVEVDAPKDVASKNLISVFVQDEEVFEPILEKIAGIESSSLVVLTSENASVYLSRIPLFASFWNNDKDQFSRMVIAIVDKGLANETIRRIESITGNLSDRSGVMIVVQEISYFAGALNAKM